mmetsp:Transcript_114614/g.319162  ORF Transcript_114614/g.319162 Transcript_114614/m.319162 type:complete len:202 (+) Transcript_114614:946-1551(+)
MSRARPRKMGSSDSPRSSQPLHTWSAASESARPAACAVRSQGAQYISAPSFARRSKKATCGSWNRSSCSKSWQSRTNVRPASSSSATGANLGMKAVRHTSRSTGLSGGVSLKNTSTTMRNVLASPPCSRQKYERTRAALSLPALSFGGSSLAMAASSRSRSATVRPLLSTWSSSPGPSGLEPWTRRRRKSSEFSAECVSSI